MLFKLLMPYINKGTEGGIDDYIEKKVFGRDV